MAAMTFVTGMCVFQLTRNVLINPDVRINKAHRTTAVLENQEEGKKYSQHGLRKFLRSRPRKSCLPSTTSSPITNRYIYTYGSGGLEAAASCCA
ncbi:hypothetical protein C3L33_01454, partial [Rhododendron williamsianum]